VSQLCYFSGICHYIFLKSSYFPVEFFPLSGPLPISASIDVCFLQLLIFLCILITQKFVSPIFASFAVLIYCFAIIVAAANIKLFIVVVCYSFSSKHSILFISSFSCISYCFPSVLLMFPFQEFVEASLYTTFVKVFV